MRMKWIAFYLSALMFLLSMSIALAHNALGSTTSDQVYPASAALAASSDPILDNAQTMITAGRQTFRFDTFGDEAFWGGQLQLHRAIEGANLGGVGPGVSPRAALALGLKVDLDALPSDLVDELKKGQVDLDDPATTLALLKLKAVVGLTG